MRSNARRLDCLDGVRGVAALVVVVFHYLSAFVPALTPDQTSDPYWLADTPLAILFNGPFAVILFFVLSGFVISKSADKLYALPPTIALRYLRLTIPMLASVIAAWLLLSLFPNEATRLAAITGTPWLSKTFNGAIPSLFSAVKDGTFEVYLHGRSRFNNALWSMRPELIGSVGIYVIYAFVRHRTYRVTTLVALFFLLLWKGHPYYYEAFIFGALIQEAWTANRLSGLNPLLALAVGVVLGSQSTDFAGRYGLDFLPTALRPGVEDGLIYPVAAALIMYASLESVVVSRFFQVGLCLFLGRISFGLYLIHVPVAYTLVMAVALAFWPMSPIALGLGLFLFMMVSISLGWLMTLVVDTPTLRVQSAIRKASRSDHSYLKAKPTFGRNVDRAHR
jgi:peptidoglycan/LPS O-acetylase OafA/YrhL